MVDLERLNWVGADLDRVSVTSIAHKQVTNSLSVNPTPLPNIAGSSWMMHHLLRFWKNQYTNNVFLH